MKIDTKLPHRLIDLITALTSPALMQRLFDTLVLAALVYMFGALLLSEGVLAQTAGKPKLTATDANAQGRVLAAKPQGLDQRLVVFPYDPNAIYPIQTRVDNFTTFAIAAQGETVVGVYLSDTLNWEMHVTPDKRDVMVKPKAPGLRTTGTIKTNKRAYILDFKEVREGENVTWHQRVSWQVAEPAFEDYTASPAPAVSQPQVQAPNASSATSAGQAIGAGDSEGGECRGLMVDITRVSQQYVVKGNAPFAPRGGDGLVFDNGQHTYVRLPSSVQEVPAIFGLDRSGQAELVNYRLACGMYKIDRVMDYGLLLKLGEQEVTVTRKSADCGWFGWGCSSKARNISQ